MVPDELMDNMMVVVMGCVPNQQVDCDDDDDCEYDESDYSKAVLATFSLLPVRIGRSSIPNHIIPV